MINVADVYIVKKKKKKKEKKKILARQPGPLRGSSSPLWRIQPARVNPIKLAYEPTVTQNSPFLP